MNRSSLNLTTFQADPSPNPSLSSFSLLSHSASDRSTAKNNRPVQTSRPLHRSWVSAGAIDRRRGLTLIEIMIALTVTLIILGAMMTAFQFASGEMRQGRALIELASRVRVAEDRLRSDLRNLTVEPRPYTQTAAPSGYFEYIEGPQKDDSNAATVDGYIGDIDDILAMTVRAEPGQSFRGRHDGSVIESSLAEVVWFTTTLDLNNIVRLFQNVDPETLAVPAANFQRTKWANWTEVLDDVSTINFGESVRVHRRVLLIRPDLGVIAAGLNINEANQFLASTDISCRVLVSPPDSMVANDIYRFTIVANNLTDLANRRNRFCRDLSFSSGASIEFTAGTPFPHNINPILLLARMQSRGSDILLADVAGFDLKVYSPNANVNTHDADLDGNVDVADGDTGVNLILEPGDLGYVNTTHIDSNNLGAYVDLAYDVNNFPAPYRDDGAWFSGFPNVPPSASYSYVNTLGTNWAVFDTWTPLYESDGLDQDRVRGIDQGTDGLDSDNANGVDDTGERETLPPYPHPIRGMKISIRLVEKGTKQIHQASVIQSFVPE